MSMTNTLFVTLPMCNGRDVYLRVESISHFDKAPPTFSKDYGKSVEDPVTTYLYCNGRDDVLWINMTPEALYDHIREVVNLTDRDQKLLRRQARGMTVEGISDRD